MSIKSPYFKIFLKEGAWHPPFQWLNMGHVFIVDIFCTINLLFFSVYPTPFVNLAPWNQSYNQSELCSSIHLNSSCEIQCYLSITEPIWSFFKSLESTLNFLFYLLLNPPPLPHTQNYLSTEKCFLTLPRIFFPQRSGVTYLWGEIHCWTWYTWQVFVAE